MKKVHWGPVWFSKFVVFFQFFCFLKIFSIMASPSYYYESSNDGNHNRRRSLSPEEWEAANKFVKLYDEKQTQRKRTLTGGSVHTPHKSRRTHHIQEAQSSHHPSTMALNKPKHPFKTPMINQHQYNQHMQMQQHGRAARQAQQQQQNQYHFEPANQVGGIPHSTRRVTPVGQSIPPQFRQNSSASATPIPGATIRVPMSQVISKIAKDKEQYQDLDYGEGSVVGYEGDGYSNEGCENNSSEEDGENDFTAVEQDEDDDSLDVEDFLNNDPFAPPPASVFAKSSTTTTTVVATTPVSTEKAVSTAVAETSPSTEAVSVSPVEMMDVMKKLLNKMSTIESDLKEVKHQLATTNAVQNRKTLEKMDEIIENNKKNNNTMVDYTQGAMEWIKSQFTTALTNNIQEHMNRIQSQRQAFGFTSGMSNTLVQNINPQMLQGGQQQQHQNYQYDQNQQQQQQQHQQQQTMEPTNDPYMPVSHYTPSPSDFQQSYHNNNGEMIDTSPTPEGGYMAWMSAPPNEGVFMNNQHHGFLSDVQQHLPQDNSPVSVPAV
jgi:hypothetical protein